MGTQTILQSALDYAEPQLKSFVMTSSIAAIKNPHDPPHVFTEEEWDITTGPKVAELGKNSPGPMIYGASKTAAERAMWSFKEKNPSFPLTAINPGYATDNSKSQGQIKLTRYSQIGLGPTISPPRNARRVERDYQSHLDSILWWRHSTRHASHFVIAY